MFKPWDTKKGLEGLKKIIIKIYNIEKQIYLNDSKKETKFKQKMAYTRKTTKINEIYHKRCLDGATRNAGQHGSCC